MRKIMQLDKSCLIITNTLVNLTILLMAFLIEVRNFSIVSAVLITQLNVINLSVALLSSDPSDESRN